LLLQLLPLLRLAAAAVAGCVRAVVSASLLLQLLRLAAAAVAAVAPCCVAGMRAVVSASLLLQLLRLAAAAVAGCVRAGVSCCGGAQALYI
jgi:hypothetical protein